MNKGLPTKIHSYGGRFGYKDQAETPNTQIASFEYEDGTMLSYENRGLHTNEETGVRRSGAIFYGSDGYMVASNQGYQIFLKSKKKPEPEQGRFENVDHLQNFIDAVREGKREILNGEIEEIFTSNSIGHLGNIAYRLGRELRFDPTRWKFVGDEEANRLLSRVIR